MSTSVLGVSTLSFIRSTSVVPPAMNFAWVGAGERFVDARSFDVTKSFHDVSSPPGEGRLRRASVFGVTAVTMLV